MISGNRFAGLLLDAFRLLGASMGVLILRGCVASYYGKQIPQTVARPLDRMLSIENQA
jgi:hypothetical protein